VVDDGRVDVLDDGDAIGVLVLDGTSAAAADGLVEAALCAGWVEVHAASVAASPAARTAAARRLGERVITGLSGYGPSGAGVALARPAHGPARAGCPGGGRHLRRVAAGQRASVFS
jgi:hypothetical protein